MRYNYLKLIIMGLVFACSFSISSAVYADGAKGMESSALNHDIQQPYVVKKGDTLWDIADYFFKNPEKWLKIWEKNLYISNPDLIYPGSKIWFDQKVAAKKKEGGLTSTKPHPVVRIKPVERLEPKIDPKVLLAALARQDFIQESEINGAGYILDSEDDRINYGLNDHLYLRMLSNPNDGDIFDIFRTGNPVTDPETGKVTGLLINHLGQIVITSKAGELYRGTVLASFEELSRGDRLKLARNPDTTIVPSFPTGTLKGKVLYIRHDAAEAGQHQVIGISLGKHDGLTPGTSMSIHRAGRDIPDLVTSTRKKKQFVTLPEEKIGELIVLVAQENASIALVTRSSGSINIGDVIRNRANN
ncbi:MAG: LysM peptidoglycan-binding domain-containing protein [Mariprofundaceae bacterium]